MADCNGKHASIDELLKCAVCGESLESLSLACPECGEEVWDGPRGSKLAKCWNADGHAHGGPLAFDTMPDDAEQVDRYRDAIRRQVERD